MNSKTLLIENDVTELNVFINSNDKIAITLGDNETREVIELDLDDTLALIMELKLLSKSIK